MLSEQRWAQAGTRISTGLTVLLVLGAAGCGDTTRPPTRSAAERPLRREHRSHNGMLQRHDLPPAGVRAQITYFQEGGPPECRSDPSGKVTFGRGLIHPPRASDHAPDASSEPERGELLALCAGHVGDPRRLVAKVRTPDGTVHTTIVSGGAGIWYMGLADRAPLGRYLVDVRQGRLHVRGAFTLRAASQPEYHITGHDHDRVIDITLLGLRPHERAQLLFYRALPSADTGAARAEYVTSTVLRMAADGVGSYRLTSGPHRPPCTEYVVKARVRGRLLDDLGSTLSTFDICRQRSTSTTE